MAMSDTRQSLNKLIHNYDAKVIVASGLWGSGKTYLWCKIKESSQDEKIKNARYISLYGVGTIKQVKESLLRNIIGTDSGGGNIRKKISSLSDYVTNITSQFVKGVPAVLDFSDVALPFYLKDAFIVIDDIERLDDDLSLRQLMGFINEYVTQYQTRFLLILNKERVTEENEKNWKEMNEKIVDYELSHTITPEEAFNIASTGHKLDHRDELLKAIEILNINNIRVIQKILNICAIILPDESKSRPGALSRVIPSIVLTGAVYYKVIKLWESNDEYINFMRKLNSLSLFHIAPKQATDKEKEAYSIVEKLGLIIVDGLVSAIFVAIESALTEDAGLRKIVSDISTKESELLAQNNYLSFYNSYYWDFKKNDETLLHEAEHLLKDVKYLIPRDISGLLNFMGSQDVFVGLVDSFRDEWVKHNGNKRKSYPENELKTVDGENIRNDIYYQVNIASKPIVLPSGVKEALRHISENHSWGERQMEVFRSATVESIKTEIEDMSGDELKKFIGDAAFVSQPSMAKMAEFSDIAFKLKKSVVAIISETQNLRLKTVLSERIHRFVPSQDVAETGDDLNPETH